MEIQSKLSSWMSGGVDGSRISLENNKPLRRKTVRETIKSIGRPSKEQRMIDGQEYSNGAPRRQNVTVTA